MNVTIICITENGLEVAEKIKPKLAEVYTV